MRKYLYTLSFSLIFTGCNYLEMVPEKDIETIDTKFEKQVDAETWLASCYYFLQNINGFFDEPAYLGADELVGGEYVRSYAFTGSYSPTDYSRLPIGLLIGDGLQNTYSPYGNIWHNKSFYAAIRYCNIFLEKIWNVYNMDDDEKLHREAEIKALKAMLYFELMRRYGPIILVPKNIDSNAEIADMQKPRSPVDECVRSIVDLLDEAAEVLPAQSNTPLSRWNYFSLESALALKARVLLYAASPLFNGNEMYANFKNKKGQLLFPAYDHEKWKLAAEAAEVAIQAAIEGGKELIKSSTAKITPLLNRISDVEYSVLAENHVNSEAIFTIRFPALTVGSEQIFKWTLPRVRSNVTDHYDGSLRGCIGPSMKMVEMYYTVHGLPIDADRDWNYSERYKMGRETNSEYNNVVLLDTEVLQLHLRREPRFYAHIAAGGTYWARKKKNGSDDNLLVEPYSGQTFGTTSNYIDVTTPQNITGYWLKKHILPTQPTYQYKYGETPTIYIRMAELYLIAAEAWNEYEGPGQKVYDAIDVVRKRAGIPGVVESWESYSNSPNKVKTKEGMRDIIRREINIEFAFEGHRFFNLRRWMIAHEILNESQYGWNVIANNAQAFYNNYEGPIVVWGKRQFVAPRDYFFPIRSEEILISGCEQTLGWGEN